MLKQISTGEIVTGKVTNITKFGVFVDLGGIEGLIHISELSWGRVEHPKEISRIGDEIQAQVMQINEVNMRIALSIKRLLPNPWMDITRKYRIGDVIPAMVSSKTRFGIFVRLEEGVEGLIHNSTFSKSPQLGDIFTALFPGQKIMTKIIDIDCERRRLGLVFINQ